MHIANTGDKDTCSTSKKPDIGIPNNNGGMKPVKERMITQSTAIKYESILRPSIISDVINFRGFLNLVNESPTLRNKVSRDSLSRSFFASTAYKNQPTAISKIISERTLNIFFV